MDKLLIKSKTKRQVEAFVKRPSHAVLIIGAAGSGKNALSWFIANQIVNDANNYPYLSHIKKPDDKQEISIDQIRQLKKKLSLKAVNAQQLKLVIIEDADYLSEEAQNAMLKMLEEPSGGTIFLLSASSTTSLLPTIVSRSQLISIYPASLREALNYYKNRYDEPNVSQAWQLSQGRIGLMNALLNEKESHPLKQSIKDAKVFLKKDYYQRLLAADSLAKDKKQLQLFLDALSRLLSALQNLAADKNNQQQSHKILNSRRLVVELQTALEANVSPRLIMLKLSLNLLA